MNTPASETAPVIEMRDVDVASAADPEMNVAEAVNWSAAAGEFWVIGGPQGSGKSDFLMMTGGLTAPKRGSYQLFGKSMPFFDERQLRERLRVGFVFDHGRPFNHLTVSENVALPLRYHGNLTQAEADSAVNQLLELTELTPWANNTPGTIPANWQKRVGLARALALKPEVLLLDNPLTGLDLRHHRWWLAFLSQLSTGHEWMGGIVTNLVVTVDDFRPWQTRARRFAIIKNKQFTVLGGWEHVEASRDEAVHELLAMAVQNG